MASSLSLPDLQLRVGQGGDRALLLQFMQRTYGETNPQSPSQRQHLDNTLDHYWSTEAPLWFVFAGGTPIACLWLGQATDPVTGERSTHVLLLYVDPEYRRQGIGTALMQQAEDWARQRCDRTISLQVLESSQPAQSLYHHLGYRPYARTLVKPVEN
jgi:GNAT superfamily N-acetyltransferase